jgi:hypothetical protein
MRMHTHARPRTHGPARTATHAHARARAQEHAHKHAHKHTRARARSVEERALQQAVGVKGFGDMAALMAEAPRDLIELLRINTVIRAASNRLVCAHFRNVTPSFAVWGVESYWCDPIELLRMSTPSGPHLTTWWALVRPAVRPV